MPHRHTTKRSYLADLLVFLGIAAAGFIVIGDIFKPGIMIIYDNPMHFVEVDYLVNKFIPARHWIDGWCMQAPLGQPMLLYTYQLGGWLIAILNLILKVDLNIAYKILIYFSYLITPAALYVFASKRFGRPAGAVCAFLFMFQKLHIDMLLSCAWNNYLALGLLVILFDLLDRRYRDISMKDVAVISIVESLIIIAHPITHIVSFIFILSVIVIYAFRSGVNRKTARNIFYMAIVPLAGSLIVFFYIYNLFVTKSWLAGFAHPWLNGSFTGNVFTMIRNIFGGFDAYPDWKVTVFANAPELLRSVLAVAGMIFVFIKREDRFRGLFAVLFLFAGICLFLFSDAVYSVPVLTKIPLVKTITSMRLLVYLHLALCLFAAYAVKCLSGYMAVKKMFSRKWLPVFAGLCLVSCVCISDRYFVRSAGFAATTESPIKEMDDIKALWRWAGANLDKDHRILLQSTYNNGIKDPALDRSHVLALGIYYTPLKHVVHCGVGNYYPTYKITDTSSGRLFGSRIGDITDDEVMMYLRAFNIRYIVTLEPEMERRIARIERCAEIKRIGRFTIFERYDPSSGWAEFTRKYEGNDYSIETFDDEYIKVRATTPAEDNGFVFKVAYHPYWSAYIDGRPVPLARDRFGLMQISLKDRGPHVVEFRYDSKKPAPIAVSFITLTLCIAIIVIPRQE